MVQHVLQEEGHKVPALPSRRTLKRAAREAAAAAQAAAAGKPAAPAPEAAVAAMAMSSTTENAIQAAAGPSMVAAGRSIEDAADAVLDQQPFPGHSRVHGCWYRCAITQVGAYHPVADGTPHHP